MAPGKTQWHLMEGQKDREKVGKASQTMCYFNCGFSTATAHLEARKRENSRRSRGSIWRTRVRTTARRNFTAQGIIPPQDKNMRGTDQECRTVSVCVVGLAHWPLRMVRSSSKTTHLKFPMKFLFCIERIITIMFK